MTLRVAVLAAAVSLVTACGSPPAGSMRELQRAPAGGLEVVLLAPADAIDRGRSFAILEFHDRSGSLVDMGSVTVRATMPHPGAEPMAGGSEVKPTPAPGRYEISTDFSMAGTWDLAIAWDGPRGRGSARLAAPVR
jgi:hypothetical protein